MSFSSPFSGVFKVLLLGDEGVGKSALLSRYCDNRIDAVYEPTFNVDFKNKSLDIEGKQFKLQFWDATGKSSYAPQLPTYLTKVHAVLICFDTTDGKAFTNLTFWKTMCDNYCSPDAFRALVATKIDREERVLTADSCNEFAETWKMPIFEISATMGTGVQELFRKLIVKVRALPDPLTPHPNAAELEKPTDPGGAGSSGLALMRSASPQSFAGSETASNAPLVKDRGDIDIDTSGDEWETTGCFCCTKKVRKTRKPTEENTTDAENEHKEEEKPDQQEQHEQEPRGDPPATNEAPPPADAQVTGLDPPIQI